VRRREFITLLGGAAVAWPLAARAQQSERMRRIGVFTAAFAADDPEGQARVGAFQQGLQQLGRAIGRNLQIEYRWGAGDVERTRKYAAELVALAPEVILTSGASTIGPLLQATRTVPIVFVNVSDPVGAGFVDSLARPGGNATGLSTQSSDTASKRLEILREFIPGFRRLAVLGNATYAGSVEEMREVLAVAEALGLEVDKLEIRRADDIAPAFEQLKSGAQALYVCTDALANANRHRINILALGARLPTMLGLREYVDPAGLMSYGPHIPDLFRRAADQVDKILRGAKPGDLPVEQPTFELIINLTVAKALGLKLSEAFLLRADEVIE
jgi:ABC-type uncharacterized transport system substrate-binding protein